MIFTSTKCNSTQDCKDKLGLAYYQCKANPNTPYDQEKYCYKI